MELKEALEQRRSIRKFSNRKVDKEVIQDIIYYGTLAPSAKNKQPWYFVVVNDEIRNKIADCMIDYDKLTSDNSDVYGFKSSVLATAKVIKQSPTLILILRQKDHNWIVGDNLSIGACIENMSLRAVDLGLGSLWIRDTVYVDDKIIELLGEKDKELNSAFVIGYQKEYPNPRKRKELSRILKWY